LFCRFGVRVFEGSLCLGLKRVFLNSRSYLFFLCFCELCLEIANVGIFEGGCDFFFICGLVGFDSGVGGFGWFGRGGGGLLVLRFGSRPVCSPHARHVSARAHHLPVSSMPFFARLFPKKKNNKKNNKTKNTKKKNKKKKKQTKKKTQPNNKKKKKKNKTKYADSSRLVCHLRPRNPCDRAIELMDLIIVLRSIGITAKDFDHLLAMTWVGGGNPP